MKEAVYERPRTVTVKDVTDAEIEHLADILLRITTTNIYGSDLLGLAEGSSASEQFDNRDDGRTKAVLHPGTGRGKSGTEGFSHHATAELRREARARASRAAPT